MPLDGYGGFNPPSPENPVRAGTLIKSNDFNSTVDDISDALSTAIYKDGQAAMEADLNMGHNNIVQINSVQNDRDFAVRAKGDIEIQATGNVNIGASLSINNSKLAVGITNTGGLNEGNKLVLTDRNGLLDGTFVTFLPGHDSDFKGVAATDLHAGDFICMTQEGQFIAATVDNLEDFVIGFTLEDCTAGDYIVVHCVGYNNKVAVRGAPSSDRIVYIADEGANVVSYEAGKRKQAVGVVIGESVVRFLPQLPIPITSPLFLYMANI